MPNRFEKPATMSKEISDFVLAEFEDAVSESDCVFVRGKQPGEFTTHARGRDVYFSLDHPTGVLRIGADTGIVLPRENPADLWAYASFCMAYRYNFCNLATTPDDRYLGDEFSWEPGEHIHFYFDVHPEKWEVDALADMAAQCTGELHEDLAAIISGDATAMGAVARGKSLSARMREMLRHMREEMLFDEDDE